MTGTSCGLRPIFSGPPPMRVAVLASGSGGNLGAVSRLAERRPDLIDLALVASDRPSCAAVTFARERGLPVIAREFRRACGRASDASTPAEQEAYAARARRFHDLMDDDIDRFERDHGRLDLIVLAYGRWIHGRLLQRWEGRMINQHPADLSILDARGRRALTGNNPVLAALRLGVEHVRTSTFLVDEGQDTGGIVCQGPPVSTAGFDATQRDADALELVQKRQSDWPSLICALVTIARGVIALDASRRGPDDSPCFRFLGSELPFGGLDVERLGRGEGPLDDSPIVREILNTMRSCV